MAVRLARRAQGQPAPLRTVEALGREWHARQAPRWTPRYAAAVITNLERKVFPVLGRLHINDVTPPLMLACIRQIEARGAHATAHIVRQHMHAVFAYAIAAGIGQSNPAAHIEGGTLAPPSSAASGRPLLTLDGVRGLLRQIEACAGPAGDEAGPPPARAFGLPARGGPSRGSGREFE